MAGRSGGRSRSGWGGSRGSSVTSLASLVLEGDELTYMTRLKDILDAYPNKGPPYEPSQLCEHVFIGSQRNADDLALLRRLGITHVVNCCGNRKLTLHLNPYPRITGIMHYIAFPAEDQSDYYILQHVAAASEMLDQCKRMGGRALVHCNLGINRSGAVCAAYLMTHHQRPLLATCELLKKKRSVVLCNKGFRRQLVKFARARGLLGNLEPRSSYMSRSGSASQLRSGYSDRSIDIVPGEVGTSRPLTRSSSSSNMRSSSSPSSPSAFGRGVYRPSAGGTLSSFSPIEETQSAPQTPTRYHPAYCTLPRGAITPNPRSSSSSSSSSGSKRSIAASHYDQEYFMDTIPEDGPRHGADAPRDRAFAPPSRHYLVNLPKLSSGGKKVKAEHQEKVTKDKNGEEWVVSSTRPLRVYKRASTDSLLYQKPSSLHAYKRADTVATTDLATGLDKLRLEEQDDPKLTRKHRSSSRSSLASLSSGFFSKLKSRSRTSLQNF